MHKLVIVTLIATMSVFSFLSSAAKGPYKNEAYNQIYGLLFCDNVSLFKTTKHNKARYPWNILLSSSSTVQQLEKVANDKSLESRARILAYRAIAAKGLTISGKQLLGVVIEVGMPEGLDVLAA